MEIVFTVEDVGATSACVGFVNVVLGAQMFTNVSSGYLVAQETCEIDTVPGSPVAEK